jgi:hypothetical protein
MPRTSLQAIFFYQPSLQGSIISKLADDDIPKGYETKLKNIPSFQTSYAIYIVFSNFFFLTWL